MKYTVKYTEKAKDDVEKLKSTGEISVLKKLKKLLFELEDHPYTGTGQIEKLKHYKVETWSRHISSKHRLCYRIGKEEVLILSACGHYEDK
jgi:toxin YoeB